MTFKTVRELVQSICPASLSNMCLSTLSLALWAYVISFLLCLFSSHSKHSGPKAFPPYPFPGSVSLCSNATSLVRSYFFFFCVFLFIIVFLHCMRAPWAYGLAPFTTVVSSICIRVPNTQELLSTGALRGWVGGGRRAGAVSARVCLSGPCQWWGRKPGAVCIVSIQHSFAK